MERRRLQALINSAASRSASILLVEEDLEDIPQLNPPAALAFVAPERWEAEGAGSDQRLTIAVAGSRLSLSPLERCLLPFAEYTITVHCDNEAWSVRRRFSAFESTSEASESRMNSTDSSAGPHTAAWSARLSRERDSALSGCNASDRRR